MQLAKCKKQFEYIFLVNKIELRCNNYFNKYNLFQINLIKSDKENKTFLRFASVKEYTRKKSKKLQQPENVIKKPCKISFETPF